LTSLTAIVITKNEEENIAACLQSVSFANQIVVLDGGSTDETATIAASAGAEVSINKDWPGFGVQKNRALALAKEDWVLSIDADERVSEELANEIQAVLVAPQFDVYNFPRLSSYCGQEMHHSGWYPDRVARLFRRGSARFSDDLIHESLVTQRVVGQLQSPLLHRSFDSLEDVLDKVNAYSSAGARQLQIRGKRSSLGKALVHGLWTFFRTYVLRLGFLDGKMGFVLAISNAEGTYYRYLKLWLLGRDESSRPGGP
jgi:glycosyltransferase involved in cell wall biosynthesis